MERVGGVDMLPIPHLLYLPRPDRKEGTAMYMDRGVRNIRYTKRRTAYMKTRNSIHEKREHHTYMDRGYKG